MTENSTNYTDNSLSLWAHLQVRMHLAMCRDCRSYFRQMEQTVGSLERLKRHTCNGQSRAEAMQTFAKLRTQQPKLERSPKGKGS